VSVFSQADWSDPQCPLDFYRANDPTSTDAPLSAAQVKAGADAFDIHLNKSTSLRVDWFSSRSLLRKGAAQQRRLNKNALYIWQWKPTIISRAQDTRPEMIPAVRQVMRDLRAKVVRDNVE
jgi:hypothetical protein